MFDKIVFKVVTKNASFVLMRMPGMVHIDTREEGASNRDHAVLASDPRPRAKAERQGAKFGKSTACGAI
ncbi:MAG TPA: hypothetical protein VIE65_07370, partial [Methylobacter sp.]